MMALVSSINRLRESSWPREGVVKLDPWLSPFKEALKHRYNKAQQWIKTINDTEGGLEKFSRVGASVPDFKSPTDQIRERRSLDSMWIKRTTLPIGNGLQMRRKHSLLVNSVFLSPGSRLPSVWAYWYLADDWNRESYPMKKDAYGVFEIQIPARDGQPAIAHNSKVKVSIEGSVPLSR